MNWINSLTKNKRSTGYYNILFDKEEIKKEELIKHNQDNSYYFESSSNASSNPKPTAKVCPIPEK